MHFLDLLLPTHVILTGGPGQKYFKNYEENDLIAWLLSISQILTFPGINYDMYFIQILLILLHSLSMSLRVMVFQVTAIFEL